MKYFYYARLIEKDGKQYAHGVRVAEDKNLLNYIKMFENAEPNNKTLIVQACESRKIMTARVEHWNACARVNGIYLFDSPTF